MKLCGTISKEMDRLGALVAKDPKQITSFFKNPSFCTMANSDK